MIEHVEAVMEIWDDYTRQGPGGGWKTFLRRAAVAGAAMIAAIKS